MTTQLEAIIRALEISKRPMTASELADVLVKNGSKAKKPENTVLSLVHKCRDIVNLGGSPSVYALREAEKGGGVAGEGVKGIEALRAFCAKTKAASRFCQTEADVREKIVVPVLRDWMGYDPVADMQFERFINADRTERPDIVVVNGRKRLFFVEIKNIGSDLSRAESQLTRYFKMMDRPPVRAGILTDGIRWRFFVRNVRSGIPCADGFLDASLDCPDMDLLDTFVDFGKADFNNDVLRNNAETLMRERGQK